MMFRRQKWTGVAAALALTGVYAMPTMANVQTWTFNSANQSFSSATDGNTLSLTSSDGIHLTVSGWSDTNDVSGDDTIESAKLIWAQSAALGIQNRDEDTNSPNHSIDSDTTDSDGEFDMLLLEFDTAINLNGIDLAWAVGGNAADRADVSILAWNGSGSSALSGATWAGILDTNGGGFDSVGNYSNVGLSYFTVNTSNIESTKWLVGVYNPVYGAGGDAGDDGIKLASIQTSTKDTPPDDEPPGDVPAPGTLVLMLAGLAALRNRRSAK